MAIHIKELTIESYRGINGLQLKELNGINILTGDNNSGKTSVLELLSTLRGPDTFTAWNSCCRMSSRSIRRMYFESLYSLFSIDQNSKKIEFSFLSEDNQSHTVGLGAEIYETQLSEAEINIVNGMTNTRKMSQIQDQPVLCMELRAHIDGETIELSEVYDFQSRFRYFGEKTNKAFYNAIFIQPFAHTTERINMNAIMSDRDYYRDFIDILKEYDPEIEGITALQAEYTGMIPDYRVLTRNHKEGLPLSAFGDGMKKAILMSAEAIRAKGGILLLDEFETAIHTSAMSQTFAWILNTAIKMNVQVFLTSHSKEAIEKVLNLDDNVKSQINLYTLYNYNGQSAARRMTCYEAIEASEDLGVELR